MPEVHARLSASGAKRWINCPPSVALEEKFPNKDTVFTQEGTLAHSLAELMLRYNNRELNKTKYNFELRKIKENELFSNEMLEYLSGYAASVWEKFNEVKKHCEDAVLLLEQRLDFSEYVPEGFGTGDVLIIADDTLEVIDLKYGKGVGVSAEDNPQLRLYGLGAYLEMSMLYDISKIKMTIMQPRLDIISTEELSVEDLLTWAEEVIRPAAKLAMTGEGSLQVGDHCRFCKAFATCRAQKEYQLEMEKLEFADPELLEKEEIGDVLTRVDALVKWAEAIKEYAYDQALNHGVKFAGWKLVEGRSNRKFTDPVKVADTLLEAGWNEEQIYKPQELITLTAMEKLIGKKKLPELLDGLIEKPEGKPTLVLVSDKREELNTVAKAAEDFDDELPFN